MRCPYQIREKAKQEGRLVARQRQLQAGATCSVITQIWYQTRRAEQRHNIIQVVDEETVPY
jgi:hypothetical protein